MYTPNLGSGIALLGNFRAGCDVISAQGAKKPAGLREREQGRFRGSSEGALREQGGSKEGA